MHHSCVYSRTEDGTGKEKNVTIGIILEKVNKTIDEPNEIGTSDNLDMTDQDDEEGGGEEDHEEEGETIMRESQEITTTPKVHFNWYFLLDSEFKKRKYLKNLIQICF